MRMEPLAVPPELTTNVPDAPMMVPTAAPLGTFKPGGAGTAPVVKAPPKDKPKQVKIKF